MPNLVPYLNETPIFECMWLGVAPRTDTKKTCLIETTCSKYDNHSRLNSQHNCGGKGGGAGGI